MTTFSEVRQHKRLLVICPFPYDVAAGQRLKYEQYFDDWRDAGFEVVVSSYMDESMWKIVYERGHLLAKVLGVFRGHIRRLRDLFRVHRYDLVYVFMWITPFGTTLFERLVRYLAKRVVYDIEDNVLVGQKLSQMEHPNAVVSFLKGPGKMLYMIRTADHVISSSPSLNDTCLALNQRQRCTYISSSVDTDRFLPNNSYTNDQPVTIGWTGTFSSRPYLDLLRDVFKELAQRIPFKLKVIGNFDWEGIEGVDVEVIRWSKTREVQDLQSIDIGIYPLPIDDWVSGKSGLKAIQYMAFGLPIVATDVGTTPLLIKDGVNGLLVKTEAEWVDALERLVKNPDLRRRLGEAARVSAIAGYSTKVIAGQYRRVLDLCMEST